MGLAYGAATEPGHGGYANRIGVLVGPDGTVLHVETVTDVRAYPREVLARIP